MGQERLLAAQQRATGTGEAPAESPPGERRVAVFLDEAGAMKRRRESARQVRALANEGGSIPRLRSPVWASGLTDGFEEADRSEEFALHSWMLPGSADGYGSGIRAAWNACRMALDEPGESDFRAEQRTRLIGQIAIGAVGNALGTLVAALVLLLGGVALGALQDVPASAIVAAAGALVGAFSAGVAASIARRRIGAGLVRVTLRARGAAEYRDAAERWLAAEERAAAGRMERKRHVRRLLDAAEAARQQGDEEKAARLTDRAEGLRALLAYDAEVAERERRRKREAEERWRRLLADEE